MRLKKKQALDRQIRSVTILGIVCNVFLAIVKAVVGILAGSIALVADGIHSLSDMVTDFVVLLGVHFSAKEPDVKHPYGHGRVETLASVFIGLVLVVIGCGMIYYSAVDIAKGHVAAPGVAVLIIAVISVAVKEFLYRITKFVAKRTHSSALYANAWHHRSDALSSVAVVVGFVSLRFGFDYGDQIAAIAVGLMIVLVGIKVIGDCFAEITERAVDARTIEQISNVIAADAQILQWHKLRTRTVGREIFLDLHILVDPELSITDAHKIAENLENTMHATISRPVNITVHVEPDRPELRK